MWFHRALGLPAQHFVFGFHGHEVSNDIEVLIRDYYLG